MLDKIDRIKERFKEIEEALSDGDVFNDMKRYTELNKEYKELKKILDVGKEYRQVLGNIDSAKEMLSMEKDPEMLEMAKMELEEMQEKLGPVEERLKLLMVPKEPEDAKNAIIEIRAGTGGDEASLFAGDLHRMYTRFCEKRGWKTELIDFNEGTAGGYKEIVFKASGEDAYGTLKFEAGVHRVQRVPQTESQGRVHTSAATVKV